MPVELVVRHPKFGWKRPRKMTKKGRVYKIDGRDVELFTAKALAMAVERKVGTIHLWEREGLLPPPLFEVATHPTWRHYSAEQVRNANALYRAMEGHRNGGTRPESKFRIGEFLRRYREVFYRVDVVVDEVTGDVREVESDGRGEAGDAGGG